MDNLYLKLVMGCDITVMSSRETTSLLAWINSYKDVLNELHDGAAVTDISELADGVILSGILTKVCVVISESTQLTRRQRPRSIPSNTEERCRYFIHV